MSIDHRMSLADLAVAYPRASRVFYSRGLDYCCGGKKSLEDACRDRGLDPDSVLSEIQVEDAPAGAALGWSERPLGELIEFIVDRYHRELRSELPELVALAEKVQMRHADKASCPVGLADHLQAVHESVLDHLAKEEQVLFPMIAQGLGCHAGGPVQAMEHEHRDHARGLQRTRELAHDLIPPAEACTSWKALYLRLGKLEADLMEHIHLENNVLFPRALRES